ncbi:MAG: alanyl-tRNA editing protein, partial [Symbiobacteriaceae bacterium]|nr:alanyl-tRNA editing protein [Symbiobacteriaceae bacterium]
MREQRLYFVDPYMVEFSSPLVAKRLQDRLWHVKLEQTAFYPTSGGQPHDLGTLGGVPVQDVYEEGDEVWHLLAADPGEGVLTGCIDWERRYDFMQQHTGQHILSQAFLHLLDAATIGFHLTESSLTIDLDINAIKESDLLAVENEANAIIWSGCPIIGHWCSPEELGTLPLRKPPKVDKDIRIVEVQNYDWS